METPAEATRTAPSVPVLPDPIAGEQVEVFEAGKAVRYSAANFGAQGVFTLFAASLPQYLETYGLAPSMIGLLSNERALVAAVAQPVVGRLSDRTRTRLGRRRPFFLVGVPLMSVALMVLATHPPFWIMLGVLSIAAFFLWVALDPYVALMADLFPPSQRGRVGGILGVSQMLGSLTYLGVAILFWEQNQPLVFFITVVMLVGAFGFTFLTVKEPPLEHIVPAHVKTRPREYLASLLRYREASKYILALTFFWIGNGGVTPFVTLFALHSLGATSGESYYMPVAYVIATALFVLPVGILADRIGKKRVMSVGLLIYGAAALVGAQSTTLLQGIIAMAFIGVGNAGMAQINPLLTDLVSRKRTAELVGVGSAVTSLAQPVGSVLIGLIIDYSLQSAGLSGAYRWAFVAGGVLILMAAVTLQTVHPERFVDPE